MKGSDNSYALNTIWIYGVGGVGGYFGGKIAYQAAHETDSDNWSFPWQGENTSKQSGKTG